MRFAPDRRRGRAHIDFAPGPVDSARMNLALPACELSNPRHTAQKAARQPKLIAAILSGLKADAARTRFGCAKTLQLLSEQHPDVLYPYFEKFVGLLDSRNKIFQWEAARVLSNLARVDTQNKFEATFEKYFSPVRGPVMITAANVIRGGAGIARAKPQLADRVAQAILGVGRAHYATAECRNVAIGHALTALTEFFDLVRDPAPVLRFARRQLDNPRPATRKKALRFLKAHVRAQPQKRTAATEVPRDCVS